MLLILTRGRDLPAAVVAPVTLVLAGAVLAAVHHAEMVTHRVGEPFGSLVLAVVVTIVSPTIESGVEAAGLHHAVVGVIIALAGAAPGDHRRAAHRGPRPRADQP